MKKVYKKPSSFQFHARVSICRYRRVADDGFLPGALNQSSAEQWCQIRGGGV